jgi:hypothetical protein
MKTDELIDLLATNLERVEGGELRNTVMIALAIGAAAAFCLVLAMFGVPTAAPGGEFSLFKILALAFTLGLVAAGASLLTRSARPGEPTGKLLGLIVLLFLAIFVAALVTFVLTHPAAWGAIVFGQQWAACLVCIPLFAFAPFASLVWALRHGAPTNLVRTGAIAGLVAGALGAAVFAFHHSAGSIPFIAFWYGGPILVCSVVGALLGPRLLRW